MGRVEGFASKQPLRDCLADSLGMGLGYTWVLAGIALVRELLGNGTILSFQVMPSNYHPVLFFILPPGGFFVFSLFIALNIYINSRLKEPGTVDNEGFGCCKTDNCSAGCNAGCGGNGGRE
jgi:electron transport complex protein RnfE